MFYFCCDKGLFSDMREKFMGCLCLFLMMGSLCFQVKAQELRSSFPKGWTVGRESAGGEFRGWLVQTAKNPEYFGTIIQFGSGPRPKGTLRNFLQKMTKMWMDTKFSSSCTRPIATQVAGIDSLRINCQWKAFSPKRLELIVGFGEKTAFVASYETDQAVFQRYAPAWQSVLKSVRSR